MLPDTFISHLRQSIKSEWKFSFLVTFFSGLLVHLYRLTTPLLTWDSLYNFHDPQNTIHLGRCFLTLTCGISSYYDLPTVNGLLSLVYLSLTAVCLTALFQLKNRLSILLLGGLTVTFPTVTSTLMYMYTADGYFLAMLLATLAVLITLKFRYGFLPAMLLLGISYGSYQAYISYAVMLILSWGILQALFSSEKSLGDIFAQLGRFLFMGVGGTLLYLLSFRLLSHLEGIGASSYQGVSSMKLPGIAELLHAIPAALIEFVYFFFGPLSSISLYQMINGVLFLVLAVLFFLALLKTRVYQDLPRLLFLLCSMLVLPFACCLIYFVTPDVRYHMLMMMGFSLIYLLPVLLTEQLHRVSLRWIVLLLSALTIYQFALLANITYLQAHKSYEETYALAVTLTDRIEQLPDYEQAKKLCVLGHFDGHDDISISFPPAMTGIKEGYLVSEPGHFSAFLETYLGLQLPACTEQEQAAIASSQKASTMPIWPAQGSLYLEGDTVVLKIGEIIR